MKSLKRALDVFFTDVKNHHPGVVGLDRDLLTIGMRLKNEGTSFATVTLPSLGKHFDKCLSLGRFTPHPSFSRMKDSTLPKFLSGLFCEVFEHTGSLKCSKEVHLYVKSIREILYLFRKLCLSSDRIDILDRQAKTKFSSLESRLTSDVDLDFYTSRVANVILSSLDDFDFLPGRNGPGAVSESVSTNSKWNYLADGILSFNDSIIDLGYDLESFLRSTPDHDSGMHHADGVRLVTVPKNSNSRRTITIEPALRQFAQQALNSHLRHSITRCRILSRCLSLADQSKNQNLALIGSRDGSFATIDLSSASDLLSLSLVKKIFSGRPRFLDLCLKSRCASLSGSDTVLMKYAGMGNATTFPVQSVVFAVLAIASDLESRRVSPSYGNIVASACRIRVYGDDIIVPTGSYHQTVTRLATFGLLVNEDKSFHKGNFRESCGIDCFRGYDVTPVYIRFEPKDTSLTASAVASLVSNSNSLWNLGYYKFATYLKTQVERAIRTKLPLVGNSSSSLGWQTRRGWVQVQRWNQHLHFFEVKGLQVYSPSFGDRLDGYPALLKFFHTPLIERCNKHLEFSKKRFSIKTRPKWVQAA